MKPLSETYKELGIAFSYPIQIKDDNGKMTYCEASDGYWYKREYDANGNKTYYEDSDDYWYRYEYDANGNPTYCEEVFPEYLEFSKSELPDMIHKIK